MQEIAEYPLIMVALMEAYRRDDENEGLFQNLNKWCVVERPENYQHGYDADVEEGKIFRRTHISINAYYIFAVWVMNEIAGILKESLCRDTAPLMSAFYKTFYNETAGLFVESEILRM